MAETVTAVTPSERAAGGRVRLSIGAVIVLLLVVLSGAVGFGILRGQASPNAVLPTHAFVGEGESTAPGTIQGSEVYVHVLGEVEHPGLYVLDSGARVVDAVAAAGGAKDAADLAAVNLARAVTDGEQVMVPTLGEQTVGPGGGAAQGAPAQGDGLVDLNTADQAALETLPRIGPALAQRIIDWRDENGRFQSVDDLLAVPGIGEKLLEGLRAAVRV